MDSQTLAVVVVGIFVLLVIFIALRFKNRLKAGIKGPFGTSVDVEEANEQPAPTPGVTVSGAKSHAGGLRAEDRTGRGANVKNVEAYGDSQVGKGAILCDSTVGDIKDIRVMSTIQDAITKTSRPPISSEVMISHISPAAIKPGSAFSLEVILHLASVEPFAQKGLKLEEAAAAVQISSGAELLVSIVPPKEFDVDESEGVIVWKPPRARLQFILTAAATVAEGGYWAKVRIRTLAEPRTELCRFYIQIRVSRRASKIAPSTSVRIAKRFPRTAFASYSRKDFLPVMHRISALSAIGVNIFIDCLDVTEGTDWEDALSSNTISKDTFLLFWSRNARASTWVEKEWRHALRMRGLSYITPNALEPADLCPPPSELSALQFGGLPLLIAHSRAETSPARDIGDRRGEGSALGNLGLAWADLGEPRRELQLAIAREIRDRRGEAIASWNLAETLEKEGDLVRAADLMQVCVDFERVISHPDAEKHAAYVQALRDRIAEQS